jgi:hypothetical protein
MARKTLPLSDLQCRSAKPRERDYKLFDGGGLFLLVKANGTKSWRFRYTKPTGREGLTAFGNYPALTLAEARKRRDEARALLLQGRDPVEQKLVARQEAELARKTFQAVGAALRRNPPTGAARTGSRSHRAILDVGAKRRTTGQAGDPLQLQHQPRAGRAAAPARRLSWLMTDDYAGYNAVAPKGDIVRLGCWAHARRKFVDAQKVRPKGKTGRANMARNLINKLYGIEHDLKEANDSERLTARQHRSVPVLDQLNGWLDKTQPQIAGQTALGKAVNHLASNWSKLVRYVEGGHLPIDNNRAENARPFVIGRKNCDTLKGATASAQIYSLIETAKVNGQEPYAWLRHVLERLPSAPKALQIDVMSHPVRCDLVLLSRRVHNRE